MELAQLFHCKFFICSVDMLLSFSICMYILTISLFLFFFPDPFHCSLKAPGFAKITTNRGETGFPDISSHLAGYMELRVRSTTPSYDGFRLGFSAKDV